MSFPRSQRLGGLGGLLSLTAFLLVGCGGPEGAPVVAPVAEGLASPPQAIVLISIDTLRADFLNIDGFDEYPTSPNLDALAREGFYLPNCIVTEPWTLTSHMSLFTGLRPHRHRVNQDTVLGEEVTTLAEVLGQHGYSTQAFVDGGFLNERWGFGQGFDQYWDAKRRGLEKSLPKAVDWMKEQGDNRFFLFLHTYDVHSRGLFPFYAPPPGFRGTFSDPLESRLKTFDSEEFETRYEALADDLRDEDVRYIRARYAEGVRYVDETLQQLFEAMADLGLYEEALIIVWSDHGEGLFSHAGWGHGEVFDHTIRAPLIIKPPRSAGPPNRIESVVSSLDVMPTVIELAGGAALEGLDGVSLVPLLQGDSSAGVAFSQRTKNGRNLFSVRSQRHHLIVDALSGKRHFFDLEKDPLERTNLSPSGLEEERRLTRLLRDFLAEYQRAGDAAREAEAGSMTPELERQLRALGYLD